MVKPLIFPRVYFYICYLYELLTIILNCVVYGLTFYVLLIYKKCLVSVTANHIHILELGNIVDIKNARS